MAGLTYDGEPAALCERPGEALGALARLAHDAGAGDDWLEKALAAHGATTRSLPVARDPRYAVVREFEDRLHAAHRQASRAMMDAVRARLEAEIPAAVGRARGAKS